MARVTKMPSALRSYAEAFDTALLVPVPFRWPTEDDGETEVKFFEADQPQAIGRQLIRALHPHLANASIGYLFRNKIARRGTVVWAQASKVTGKLAHFAHLDFLIEVNYAQWCVLSPERRIALMDHELTHCGHDAEKDAYHLVPHDIEEFDVIARRWGVWRPALANFANALGEGQQLGLFPHD